MLFRGASALPVVLLVVCFAGAGIVGRDLWLTRAANQRERRMLAEFPTIAELLALAVSAGEGAIGALDRVCRLSHGELSSKSVPVWPRLVPERTCPPRCKVWPTEPA